MIIIVINVDLLDTILKLVNGQANNTFIIGWWNTRHFESC